MHILVFHSHFFAGKNTLLINILCLQGIFHSQYKTLHKVGYQNTSGPARTTWISHKHHCGDEEAEPGVLAAQSPLPASLSLINSAPGCSQYRVPNTSLQTLAATCQPVC